MKSIRVFLFMFCFMAAKNSIGQSLPKWLDTKEYPFVNRWVKIDSQQLHYVDEGKGEVLLFAHGTPSWSFDFRACIKAFSSKYRCVALDMLGFGLSDKPKKADYSCQAHADRFERFVLDMNLKDITLVVHDFGGPIALSVALKHPDRIKRVVVLNSWLWDCSEQAEYKKNVKVLKSPLVPILYRWFNFSPKFLIPSSFADKSKLSKTAKRHFVKAFAKSSEREGALAFARELLHAQAWFESLWAKKALLANKPFLFIWGMKDSFVTPNNLDKFSAGFPHALLKRLENCGHFPQEEAADETIEALRLFLEQNP